MGILGYISIFFIFQFIPLISTFIPSYLYQLILISVLLFIFLYNKIPGKRIKKGIISLITILLSFIILYAYTNIVLGVIPFEMCERELMRKIGCDQIHEEWLKCYNEKSQKYNLDKPDTNRGVSLGGALVMKCKEKLVPFPWFKKPEIDLGN